MKGGGLEMRPLSLRVKVRSRRLGFWKEIGAMSPAVRVPRPLNRNFLLGNMETLVSML